MKRTTTVFVLCCLSSIVAAAEDGKGLELVAARRIWDKAPHNAFTDLMRFHDRWFCVFREGSAHVSPDGSLRVITSADGQAWESAALITSETSDLRDAKITVTPDGRLMLSGAEAVNRPTTHKHQSLVWFSKDGAQWSERHEVGDRDNWLWRVTWHKGQAYGFGYGCRSDDRGIRLFRSADGASFDTLIAKAGVEGTYPNESSLVFLPDDTCYCLLRQDGQPSAGYVGKSRPPYDEWTWKRLNLRIGGPHMIRLPDGRLLAAVRLYDAPVRTSLCWLDPEAGTLTEALKLPSGGDTSYAGLVWHDDLLWVSYYASHEGKTAIYLAQVKDTPKSNN
ncbi:MAG: exo-alpha-sialidase [Planctomycetaceae bacterium]|nr:exo-alpha-sialidase [Planctomycetaceae bacterium]